MSLDPSEVNQQILNDVEEAKELFEGIVETLGSCHEDLSAHEPSSEEEATFEGVENLLFGGISEKTDEIIEELENLNEYISEVAEWFRISSKSFTSSLMNMRILF